MKRIPKFSRRTKETFTLLVGDEGTLMLHLADNEIIKRFFVSHQGENWTAKILRYMANHPEAPVSLLADVADQSYIQQTFPPVSRLEVNNLVKKRMERDMPNDEIRHAIPIGKKKDGRKDWQYLFVSLNSEIIQQWYDALLNLSNPITGIYLLPLEMETIMERLNRRIAAEHQDREPPKWQLIVIHQKSGGFRQVVLKDRKLAFTRLTQTLPDSTAATFAGFIEQEIVNTQEYLKRISLRDTDTFEVVIIASEKIREHIDALNPNYSSFIHYSPYHLATLFNLSATSLRADHFADTAISLLFGTSGKRRLRFGTKILQKIWRIELGRKVAAIAAMVIAPILLLWSGYSIYNTISLHNEVNDINHRRTVAQNELETHRKKNEESLPGNIDRITQIIDLYRLIKAEDGDPLELLSRFPPLLNENTRVTRVSWKGANFVNSEKESAPLTDGQLSATFTIEFLSSNAYGRSMVQRIRSFGNDVREAFSDYAIEFSNLPGHFEEDEVITTTIGEENMRNNADAQKQYSRSLTFTLKRPQK